jgi:hypothetical protein
MRFVHSKTDHSDHLSLVQSILMPESSLHKAARDGNRHEIEALINEGLNVNETGAQGTSRLQPTRRCWRRNASARVMRLGLNRVSARLLTGRTALHRALGGGFTECAQLLIEEGADPNIVDALKRTSLHWAAMGPAPHNVECCALVFAHGDGSGMLAKTTKSGSTPLHSAAGTNKPEVVRFLVGKGADQAAKDEDNMTAYDLAKVRARPLRCRVESPCMSPASRSRRWPRAHRQANGYTEVMGFLDTTKGKADGGGGTGGTPAPPAGASASGCCLVQ